MNLIRSTTMLTTAKERSIVKKPGGSAVPGGILPVAAEMTAVLAVYPGSALAGEPAGGGRTEVIGKNT